MAVWRARVPLIVERCCFHAIEAPLGMRAAPGQTDQCKGVLPVAG